VTREQIELLDRLFEEISAIPRSEQQAWLSENCPDAEVRAELESLALHATGTIGFTAAVGAAAAAGEQQAHEAVQVIGPYRIAGILGEGGMGAVYEGIRDDDQFRQRVAIKVLRLGARSESVVRRFLQERRILAELDHPNIARLFDGGTAADGSPYIVMERIDGEPLIQYAKSRNLTIRQRLELFRQVANAVQYAHQKLIVHRDIKPGNILVNSNGVPKLLDFGIAKLLDNEETGPQALTATGFPLMTPDYASPEQVQGQAVTAASDVYSLGAVLYELLSGARPHGLKSYDAAEITERICRREAPPPSTAGGPALRGDLDTIILKAMQKVPERRYNSAEQFSEDVRRYLEGMPVLARPDTATYRMKKFVGRHWVSLAATAAVVVALSAGVAVSMYQARLARERFELVRDLATRFLFDFHAQISNLSGSTKAQQMVVNTAVEYLDKLSRTAGSDQALLEELAQAYGKLATVQGGGNSSTAARFHDALVSQRHSVELYRRLAAIDPSKRLELAGSLLDEAIIEQRLAETATGLDHSREAARILDALAASHPGEKVLDECSRAYAYLSRSLRGAGKLPEALEANLKSQSFLIRVMATDKTLRPKYRLAVARHDEGGMRTDMGDPEGGVAVLERVSRSTEELMAAEPRNRNYKRFYGAHLGGLAQAYYSLEEFSTGDARKAAVVHEKRRAHCQRLVDSDPADGVARIDMAIAESESAPPMMELDPQRAVELAASGLARWDAVLEKTPGDRFTLPRRARAAMRLALAYAQVGKKQEAISRSKEASDTLRALLGKDPGEVYYQWCAVFAYTTSGDTLAAVNRDAEAVRMYQDAANLGERLRMAEQAPLSYAAAAAYAFDHFAGYWKSRGDRAQARQWLERSQQLWAKRAEHTPAVDKRREQARERLEHVEP
jgi:serine/threonine protein kinase